MKSTFGSKDYNAVIFNGGVYCVECFNREFHFPAGHIDFHPISPDSEWDAYPICDICHKMHDYVTLTDDGKRYHCQLILDAVSRELTDAEVLLEQISLDVIHHFVMIEELLNKIRVASRDWKLEGV